jgi:hypothetical protein
MTLFALRFWGIGADDFVGLLVTLAIALYLVYVLVHPEKV